MSKSSIFTNIEISDPQKIDRFLNALEESEKAVMHKTHTASAIPVIWISAFIEISLNALAIPAFS